MGVELVKSVCFILLNKWANLSIEKKLTKVIIEIDFFNKISSERNLNACLFDKKLICNLKRCQDKRTQL